MPQDERQGAGQIADDKVPVAVANAGGGEAHAHLTRLWRQELDLFHREGTANLVQNSGFHNQTHPRVDHSSMTGPMTGRR